MGAVLPAHLALVFFEMGRDHPDRGIGYGFEGSSLCKAMRLGRYTVRYLAGSFSAMRIY